MTTAQRLINEGMERGRQAGIHEGIERGIARGRQEGIYEGIERGIERGKFERDKMLVRNMLNQGLEIDDISRFTGLSKERIEELSKTVEQ
jgi:predicted transposase YdaD